MRSIDDEVRKLLGREADPEIVADVAVTLHRHLQAIRADADDEEEAPLVVLLITTNKRWISHVSEEPLTTWWRERAIAACMEFVDDTLRRKWNGRAA